jgi:hypothetical protein
MQNFSFLEIMGVMSLDICIVKVTIIITSIITIEKAIRIKIIIKSPCSSSSKIKFKEISITTGKVSIITKIYTKICTTSRKKYLIMIR